MDDSSRPGPPPVPAVPRRTFLQQAGAGLLGATLLPTLSQAVATDDEAPVSAPRIAVQLYTVRDAIRTDLAGTLRRVAEIGFDTVETAFWPDGVTLQQASRALHDAGLRVCSSHIELPTGDKRQVFLDTAAAFGTTRMIWHGWPEDKRYSSVEGTRELIGIYNEASRFAKSNGLQFGIHNHWWEYRNHVGAQRPFEMLLAELDPDIFFEVDTYWVKVAGFTPADIIRRVGRRAKYLHIKDGPAIWRDNLAEDNPDPMTAVGRGTQDIPGIARAARGTTEYMVVEMDKVDGDPFVALQESYDYLVGNRLARGRRPVRRPGRA